MRFQDLYLIASLAGSGLATPINLQGRGVQCTNGAVVYAVRGSDPGQQTLDPNPRYNQLPSGMTAAAQAVINKAGGNSYLQAIQYPAIDPSTGLYQQSVDNGIAALQGAIYDYVKNCPNGQIFVMGYSQGGQVVSGALAGSQSNGPLKVHGRLTAGVLYADPTYQDGNNPLDAGSGANDGKNGVVPGNGSKYKELNAVFGSRVRSYCQAGDQFCDSGTGPDAGAIHGNAPQFFQADATQWLTSHTK